MNTSQKGEDFITSWESIATRAYRDSAGIPTIGIGRIKGVHMGDTCSVEQACLWFAEELALEYEPGVSDTIKVPLKQYEYDAVMSFEYNVGVAGLRSSSLARLINAGDMAGAAKAFAPWSRAIVDGKLIEIPGLTARRAAEANIFTNVTYLMHDGATEASVASVSLGLHSIGSSVVTLQTMLRSKGYSSLVADGDFGLGTLQAVIDFQKRNGLVPDGFVGAMTWAKLA